MAPRITIGLPVRNGARFLGRAIESLLAQDESDFELIISDNASEDGTEELCRGFMARDPRIRYERNATDIGQIPNFNRVFERARGRYFKWAGFDDWWDPDYLSRCAAALDANPECGSVTCSERHLDDDGEWFDYDATIVGADAAGPVGRFHRMQWYYELFPGYNIDPIYSMMRREVLRRTGLFRSVFRTHLVLAAELALMGPFLYVPDILAYRRKRWLQEKSPREILMIYDPSRTDVKDPHHTVQIDERRAMLEVIRSAEVSSWVKTRCRFDVWRYYCSARRRRIVGRVTGAVRRRLWRSATTTSPR